MSLQVDRELEVVDHEADEEHQHLHARAHEHQKFPVEPLRFNRSSSVDLDDVD